MVQWRHLEFEGREGRAPVNLDIQPKNFSQVPVGDVEVGLWEMPTNCFAGDNVKEITVRSRQTTDLGFDITCQ